MSGRAIRVLESFPEPKSTTNPYIVQLADALRSTPGVELLTFDPRRALFGRYDVFHVHWPENLIGGHKLIGRIARRLTSALFFARLTVQRIPVVRTWHNLDRPRGLGRIDTALLDWLDRLTAVRIRLNEVTELPTGASVVTILHGHYRDWFAPVPHSEPVPGHLVYVGLIRPYKGVEALVAAFGELDAGALSLTLAGKASDPALATSLRDAAARDPRIRLDLTYLSEAQLAEVVTSAELVALPYRHMHNSGTVLAGLSLGRPVLVPDTEVTRLLGAEVGDQWVLRFDGDLTADALSAAIQQVRTSPPAGAPDLSAREWASAGSDHREAFRSAILRRRRRGIRPSS